MTWFKRLTGFPEKSPEQVRSNLDLNDETLTSQVNGRRMTCGTLTTPSLEALREQTEGLEFDAETGLSVREVVAEARELHADPGSAGALVQVASQVNLLEMPGPDVTPEDGIAGYERDRTQGPACAIAGGAGTIYRNYFARVDGGVGQTADRQINTIRDVGRRLGNHNEKLWKVRNGYVLPSQSGLEMINRKLGAMADDERDAVRAALRIGLQSGTEVTLPGAGHRLTQAYCSALPVSYGDPPAPLWERFARLVLEAAYEATLRAGVVNAERTGNRTVYLTLLGGGAFGNDKEWILDAIDRALSICRRFPLDVGIVSYRRSDPEVQRRIDGY
jgi:hypothetical protein